MPETDEPPLPDIPTPELEGWETDSTADTEVSAWSRQDELSKARHENTMMIHKTVKWIIPTMLILGALMFLAMSGVYVAQILLPERCRWLSPEEIQQLHSILFSSFVGGAIALAGKTYLDTPSGKSN